MQTYASHDPVHRSDRDETEHRSAIRAIDLRPEDAVVFWYRMGLTVANLRPPRRFDHAYRLGRRMAALRSCAK